MGREQDVVVVGGGAAGLSAALVLARSRRSVTVVDGGQPRNAPAEGVHGLLARDGTPPAELVRAGRREVEGYGGRVVESRVEQVLREDDGRLTVLLADGGRLTGRRLVVATGLVDELPDVPGVQERWGRDVLHCPYCHGWEVRDQAVAVLARTGAQALHQALLFRQLTDDVTVLVSHAELLPDEREQLDARGVAVVEGEVAGLVVEQDRLRGARLADGRVVPCAALVVAPRMHARVEMLAGLGLDPVPHPSGLGEHLPVTDPTGRTSAPGVWVAGNVTDLAAQVGAAAAAGALAAAAVNADLVQEDTRRAVERHRALVGSAP